MRGFFKTLQGGSVLVIQKYIIYRFQYLYSYSTDSEN